MTPLDPNPMKNKTTPAAGPFAPSGTEPAASGPPAALSAPPGASALWRALNRRWLTILVLGVGLGSLGAAVAWFVMPAKYTATATLHLDPTPPRGVYQSNEDYASWKANMAVWVKSDSVLDATLKKPETADLQQVRTQGKDALGWLKGAVVVDDKTGGPEALRLSVVGDRPDELMAASQRMGLPALWGYNPCSPEDLAATANLWAQTCDELYTAREEAKVRERLKQMRQTYHGNTELLRNKKNDLQVRRDLLGLEDPRMIDAKLQAEQTARAALQTQRVQGELQLKTLSVKFADLTARTAAPDKVEVSTTAVDEEIDKDFPQNPVVKAQIDQLLLLQKKLGERLAALPPSDRDNDPGALPYRQGIAELQGALVKEREQLRPDYEKRLRARLVDRMKDETAKADQESQGLKGQQEILDTKLREADARIATLRAGGQAAAKSNPDVESMQAEVDEMETEVKHFGEEQAALESCLPLSPRVTVTESALIPTAPTMDKRIKAALGAFLGLFVLVFACVAVVEFRARRVYQSDDVSQGLGLPLVGTVPLLPARARAVGPASEDPALGPVIESMDAIRTQLLHAGRTETLRVVMVGSAVSGEGKTTLAAHLAASLARGGRRTLLVDGDLRNPAVHRLFGLAAGPGFAELLRGEVEPNQVVQNTSLENLSLLAAGACDRRALQALAQEGILRNVLDELKEHYDFLIVDVSPVLPVADALLIGEHADAVVMSVLRNVSRLPAVYAAQQRLASLGIRILGAVMIGEGMEVYGQVNYPAVAATPPAAR